MKYKNRNFYIENKHGIEYYKSYDTIIGFSAVLNDYEKHYIFTNIYYSRTTSKQITQFCRENDIIPLYCPLTHHDFERYIFNNDIVIHNVIYFLIYCLYDESGELPSVTDKYSGDKFIKAYRDYTGYWLRDNEWQIFNNLPAPDLGVGNFGHRS